VVDAAREGVEIDPRRVGRGGGLAFGHARAQQPALVARQADAAQHVDLQRAQHVVQGAGQGHVKRVAVAQPRQFAQPVEHCRHGVQPAGGRAL